VLNIASSGNMIPVKSSGLQPARSNTVVATGLSVD
jgi:hypothetical protein